jgi:glycosyltransferase involved in cell wall biosynthesis
MSPQNCRNQWRYSKARRWILSPNHLLTSKKCKSIGAFDEKSSGILQREIGKPVITLPDIIDDTEPDTTFWMNHKIRELSNGRKIISLLGALDKRKGLLTFMHSIERLNTNNFFFVFAGKLNESSFSSEDLAYIREITANHTDNLFFYPQRIPDEAQFNSLIVASDLLFASYIDFTVSSNLIGKAAMFRKPIIVSQGFYMEELVERYRLGMAIKQGDSETLVNTIEKMVTPEYVKQYESQNLASFYMKEISRQSFHSSLEKLVSYYSLAVN